MRDDLFKALNEIRKRDIRIAGLKRQLADASGKTLEEIAAMPLCEGTDSIHLGALPMSEELVIDFIARLARTPLNDLTSKDLDTVNVLLKALSILIAGLNPNIPVSDIVKEENTPPPAPVIADY